MYKLLIYDNDIFTLIKSRQVSHLFVFDIVHSLSDLINRVYGEYQYDLLIINHQIVESGHMDIFADVNAKIIISYEKFNIQGLLMAIKIGAVDVLEKPVDLVVFKQILLKHLNVPQKETVNLSKGYSFLRTKCLIVNGEEAYALSNKERLLLEILTRNMNKITSYEKIEAYVWQGDFMSSDSLRTLIKNIRKKLPESSIRTVKGFGYMLEVNETANV